MSKRKKEARQAPVPQVRRRSFAALGGVAFSLAAAFLAVWLVRSGPDRPNLLLVTCDTTRADHIGAYGYAGAETRNLDALARRGARFTEADSAVPLTGPSHATILTGLDPPAHGVRTNVSFLLDASHVTLATLLKRAGYRTGAFVGAYPVAAGFGFGQGFDTFDEGFHEAPVPGEGAERPGNEVADAAVRWLQGVGAGPFFAWVHFYDPHSPYAPPSPYAERFARHPYDGEIAFMDAQIGRVLEALEAAGHDRDTLVVAVGDHGEGLGDHGESAHGMLVYESTLRVPLLMAGPGVPVGQVIDTPVGTVDLVPTILGLLGLPAREGLPGRDLGPALRGSHLAPEALYAESLFGRLNCRWSSLRVIRRGEWKLIEGSKPELYDLAEDPGETKNVVDRDQQVAETLRGILKAAVAKMAPGGDTARRTTLDPEQEERLRSLGYTAAGSVQGSLDEPGLPSPRDMLRLYERLELAATAHGDQLVAAIQDAEAVVREDPGNPLAYMTLGRLAYRGGQLPLADRAYAKLMELDPDRPAMRHQYGNLLRELGRLADSERELRLAAGQEKDSTATSASLAETLVAAGKTKEAEELLAGLVAKDPEHAGVQVALGRLRRTQGRTDEAVRYFTTAAERTRNVDLLVAAGETYLDAGRGREALDMADRALARSSGHPWAMAVRGHALVALGRRAEGLAVLQRAAALRPRRPDAWLALARGFDAAGDRAAASSCRRAAASLEHAG
jgi:choline-sulfatase